MHALRLVVVAAWLAGATPAQPPALSEFMAKNGSTLADEDGDYSDWIEIHNPGSAPVDLGGWFLTDDPVLLTQWMFPAVVLPPGDHLVVFASGKDRAVPGRELHTNFKLSGDGEFLALVEPDGATLATAFAPAYPPQRTDYSYGQEPDATPVTLLDSPAPCSALVPVNGELGTSWTGPGPFSAWATGSTGVGYETTSGYQSYIGLDVQAQMFNLNTSAYVRVPFTVQDPAAVQSLTLRMRYDDGFTAYLNGQWIAQANAPASPLWNSVATSSNPDAQAVRFEDFDVSAHAGALQQGANLLAIHGLNVSAGSSDFLIMPELVAGQGYGQGYGFFAQATPGGYPSAPALQGFVADVAVQTPSGFFDAAFGVTLTTATPAAVIYYTTDGSMPTATSSTPYSGPVPIQTTTCLRAAAFLQGYGPSRTATRTYLFIDDVVRQPLEPSGWPTSWGGSAPVADYQMDPEVVDDPLYQAEVRAGLTEIPTLSLVLDMADLFGGRGIYQNPQASGRAWERQVAAELIHPDGTPGFEVDCGLRIQGGRSREPIYNPKHSFSLRFRDSYGAGRLNHPVFPGSKVTSFDSLHVRHQWGQSYLHWAGTSCTGCGPGNIWGGGRSRGSLLREFWGKVISRDMGSPDAGRGRQVHLYLNGLYWGVYNIHERQDNAHYASWHGGNEDDYDALSGGAPRSGTLASWNRMKSIVAGRNWSQIQQALAVDNYIDFIVFTRYAGNTDIASGNNWRAAGGGPGNAPWRLYQWDIDHIIESLTAGPSPSVDPTNMLNTLRTVPEFVVRFGDRVHRHFFNNGALTPQHTAARWNQLAAEVDLSVVCESARWGDYRRDAHRFQFGPYFLYTKYDHVVPHRGWLMETWFPQRTALVLQTYRNQGLYPSLDAPVFGQHGGSVPAGFRLTMTGPAGARIYYTTDGSDPRLPGGEVAPGALAYAGPVTILDTVTVKARAQEGSRWSALNEAPFVVDTLVVNELLARNVTGIADEAGEREDWIELYNKGIAPVTASGLYLSDDPSNPTKWQIPPGYTVEPGETLLVWADEDGSQGPLHANFKLAAMGEEVLLHDDDGVTLLSRIAFGPQQPDISTGWLYDGGAAQLVTYLDPTPDAPNEVQGCGSRRYSAQQPQSQPLLLQVASPPTIGQPLDFVVFGGQASSTHWVFAALAATEQALALATPSRVLLAAPVVLLSSASSGITGVATVPWVVPPLPALAGQRVYAQAWTVVGAATVGSNGVELVFCP